VVIAIIAILAGLLLPALNTALKKGYETQAKTEVKAIETALKQFYAEYGRYPLDNATSDKTYGQFSGSASIGSRSNADIINVLRAIDIAPNANHTINPRRISFLEVNEKSLVDGAYTDPWSREYIIMLDTSFDGNLNPDSSTGINTLESRTIAVFSGGATPEAGTNKFIISWK